MAIECSYLILQELMRSCSGIKNTSEKHVICSWWLPSLLKKHHCGWLCQ